MGRFVWVLAVLGLLCGVAAASWWYVTGVYDTEPIGLTIAAGVLLTAYAFLDKERVVAGATSRQARYSSGALLLVVLGGALAVAAYVLAKRHDHKWDLTEEGAFTLSDETIKTVSALKQNVEVHAFFREGSEEERKFRDLVESLDQYTDHLVVDIVDPLREPMKAQQFTITTEFGTVVLVMGEERQRLESRFDQEAITNALIKLTSGEDHEVCWSVGHGESDPDDEMSPEGLGAIVLKLEDKNYTVRKVNVLTEPVPATCDVLAVIAPRQDFLPAERETLAAHVAAGGKLLVMIEPETAPELAASLERFGVKVGRNVVFEGSQANAVMGLDPSYIILYDQSFAAHPITSPLRGMVVLGIARTVGKVDGVEGINVTELLHSSPQSWAETNLDPSSTLQPDEGQDLIGNAPLAVAVDVQDPGVIGVAAPKAADAGGAGDTKTAAADGSGATDAGAGTTIADLTAGAREVAAQDPSTGVPAGFTAKEGGKVVVIGDADFASNLRLMIGNNNQDLFMNSLAWLVDEKDQLAERTNESDQLTMSGVQELLIWLVSVFLVPAGAVAMAAAVLIRRRFL